MTRRTRYVGVFALVVGSVLPSLGRAETISVNEAVARAARHNPTLHAVLQEQAAARQGVLAERGGRLPSAFAAVIGQRNERFNASREGIVRNEDWLTSGEVGVRYRTPIGSDLEVGVQLDRSARNTLVNSAGTDVVAIAPNYGGQAYVSARQPLLRGAGVDAVLGPLRQAELGASQAEHETARVASQLVLDVITAYWELWYAERAVAVQEAGEQLAAKQLEQMNTRVNELGTASRADALRFEAELATLRETLIQARTQLRLRAIDLGWLLGAATEVTPDYRASGAPPEADPQRPLAELRSRVVETSPEIAVMKATVEVARVRARVADNDNAPRLDVLATGTMTGIWTQDDLPGLSLPNGRPALAAMVGLEFDTPLGAGRECGEAGRAHYQWRAAQSRYEAVVNALMADVASSHAEAAMSTDRVRLASDAERVAAALAEAERQRFELGSTTSLDVVLVQQNHRQSEVRRLRAVVDQTIAQLRIEHQLNELLTRFAFNLDRRSTE